MTRGLALALCVVGCGTAPRATTAEVATTAGPSGSVVDGFFFSAGAPDPLACTTDADCTYGQTFDESGCCGTFRDMAATAQSTAYRSWSADWVAAHCAGHECPSPPVPSEPPECLFTVRCAAGRCTNVCP